MENIYYNLFTISKRTGLSKCDTCDLALTTCMDLRKICSKCKEKLPICEFYKNKYNKDGLSYYCKKCRKPYIINNNKYKQQYKQNIKEWFKEYKSKLKCEICSENRWWCLVFHHNGKEKKKEQISNLVRAGYSKKTILREIEKCIVLCANCHRDLHYKLKEQVSGQ